MKKITSYNIPLALRFLTSFGMTIIINSFLLFCSSALHAQEVENRFIDSVSIQKNELVVTPEITKIVIDWFNNWANTSLSYYGIKNKMQLEHLHLGKPIPKYEIVNEEFKTLYKNVDTDNASRLSDNAPLSLRFTNNWAVPVMYDEELLSFGSLQVSDYRGYAFMGYSTNKISEQFLNYVHKDLIIGSLYVRSSMTGIDYFIIHKENKEIFVEVYDEETEEYYKNEYNFNELINRLKELNLRKKEAWRRYYAYVADKTELEITPEITEIVVSTTYSLYKDVDEERFAAQGIKSRPQLENLRLGKPIPMYYILEDENLTFTGVWTVLVMSSSEPFCFTRVKLEEDGKYRWAGTGSYWAEAIYNYEHYSLITGFLDAGREVFLIIRREDKDIFVQIYNHGTREYLKNEYSFSELLNYLKK